jgi:hypothetical protein
LSPVKPETIRGTSKDQLKQLFKTKYFFKFENSGGDFDFKMESILESVSKSLMRAYPSDMKDNQHLTGEQYFGVRHKQTAILPLGITKLDLARDYAAFLYMTPDKFPNIIAGIQSRIPGSYGIPTKAGNSNPLMLQLNFTDIRGN